jgi:hypothetical protein
MGMFDGTCQDCKVSNKTVSKTPLGTFCPACLAKAQAQHQAHESLLAGILLSTGDVRENYDIVDVVMTLKASLGWDETWALVTRALREDAVKLGCNAVINIRVEHRIFVQSEQTFFAGEQHHQGIEFFACGTAVKLRGRAPTA